MSLKMKKVKKIKPETKEMPSVSQLNILFSLESVLAKELGHKLAIIILIKSFFWDIIFNRPKWNPELFNLPNEEIKKAYYKKFKDLLPFIMLFNRLKKRYKDEKAQMITAKVAVPASVPYLAKTFKPNPNIKNINEFRQTMRNYLGKGTAFEWEVKVSEDEKAVQYKFTRCGYIEILRAYGMIYAASMVCYCDHIVFDSYMPELYFERNHCKGVGDNFCDHYYEIRDDKNFDESKKYGDMKKAPYNAKKIVKSWERNFKQNNGVFKY